MVASAGLFFRKKRGGPWLKAFGLLLAPVCAAAQVIDCNPSGLFTGSLRIRPTVGCVPLTVRTSTGGERNVQNVRYQYEFNNGPYRPAQVTRDTVYTYTRPGEYRVLQLSEKDGNLRRACGSVFVYDTVAPAFVLTACRTRVKLTVPDPEKYQYHGYVVDWGDGRRDSLAAAPQELAHTYATPAVRTITVEGVYRFGCRRPTSQVFRPATGASAATIQALETADGGSLRVRIQNPAQDRLFLEQRLPDGSYRRLPRPVTGSTALLVAAAPTERVCFRLVLADSCVQAPPGPEVCYEPPPPPVAPPPAPPFRMPDAFSPNGDGLNDELRPLGEVPTRLRWQIFDRWGKLVFASEEPGRGWDGTTEGQPAPPGLYIFSLDGAWPTGPATLRGQVWLLR